MIKFSAVLLFLLAGISLPGCSFFFPSGKSLSQLIRGIDDATVALVSKIDGIDRPYCTGVFIAEDTILTAGHCLRTNQTLDLKTDYIVFSEMPDVGKEPRALHHGKPIKIDALRDLGLVRVSGIIPPHRSAGLAERAEIGEIAFVVGHVGGLYYSLQEGIVAAERASLPPELWRSAVLGPFLQISGGAIWKGDSGASVFNSSGKIIGVVSFEGFAPGEGFAIALPSLREFLRQLP